MTFEKLWTEKLRLCSCGCPEETAKFLIKILSAYEVAYRGDKPHDEFIKLKKMADELLGNQNTFYLLMYLMDSQGWFEHGSGIGASWLSEKGKEILDDLIALENKNELKMD